ncbi:MAG: hypothetical protein A2036_04320 [Omnitrophica bacterium GWA2_50_21]|nr:MAG: hypothetical protein A2036_04320 [Omnitrophica bacterium GWA2_50_21]
MFVRMASNRQGFTLFEVLIALVIIALAVTVSLGGIAAVLRFSEKMNQRTEAMSELEQLLFQLESGNRVDLFLYGGRGPLAKGYQYDIQTHPPQDVPEYLSDFYQEIIPVVSFSEGKDSVALELILRTDLP